MARLKSTLLATTFGACAALTAVCVPASAEDANLLSPAPVSAIPTPALPVLPAVPVVPAPAMTQPRPTAAVPAPSAVTPASTASVPVAPAPASTQVAAPPASATIPGAAAGVSPPASALPVPVVEAKPRKKPAPAAPPPETALSTDPNPSLTPETFFATAKASERYATIADAGGWPQIEAPISPAAQGREIATLRQRLAIEGYLSGKGAQGSAAAHAGSADARWTPELTAAVKRFQALHGLKQTGLVAGATLKAMNVPANVRFTELASSAQRLAGRQFSFGDRYVVVNIPSASVEAVENGQVYKRYVAVVGDPDHPSPEVDAKVVAINLNPTWTVPVSIIKNEIIPKMQKNPGYLAKERIKILDGQGNAINPRSIDWTSQKATSYILRQDSGTGNALGDIRINMPNKYAVYMHDTPSKRFFGADMRFLSHGCVRVQGVNDLAAWLLQGTPGSPSPDGSWTREDVAASIQGGTSQELKLPASVPVTWVYLTGWSDAAGNVSFRDDVYALDTIGAPAEARADLDALTRQ